ncbi:hypothetical protein [Zoogloea sp.]|uniref:hypothetical protein n=1 Tax=Zoogloea sp. TaxID=49181 RepID=UPI00263815B6|nr:hypothetical protein [uncultured Zoogloea sp.]
MNDGIAGGLFFNSTSRARQFGGEMKRFMGRAVGFHAVALHKLSCAAQREMLKSISWIAYWCCRIFRLSIHDAS